MEVACEAGSKQKLDVSGDQSPNVGGPEDKFGDDHKVVQGLAGQWRALENARFVPKQGDRRYLMHNIREIAKKDIGVMYEWLKDIIISCQYILPGPVSYTHLRAHET